MIEIRKPDKMPTFLMSPVSPLPDIFYVPSRYALSFEHKESRYVFHNLTKQCIRGSLPEMTKSGAGYDDLIMARFLVPEGQDELSFYNHVAALARACTRKKGHGVYTILPTLGCNARCVYCYEKGQQQTTMTREIVERVIQYILETHAGPKVRLEWFGGEPLLGEWAIDRICKGLQEAELEFVSNMISNGSLITPEIIRKMKTDWKMDWVQISMDGEERDYIQRKSYIVDQDYYHRVMENISLLSEAGIKVKIHCNVDRENWDRIPQFLEDLARGVADKKNVDVHFVPLFAVRFSDEDAPMWERILSIRPLIEQAGFVYKPVIYDQIGFRIYNCKVDAGNVNIWPDGSLYACSTIAPDGRYGDIWRGITDEAAQRKYCSSDRIREKCRECPFLPNCTSFDACPVKDVYCREVYSLLMKELLTYIVDEWEKGAHDMIST